MYNAKTYICPKCSRPHTALISMNYELMAGHYDGGVWCKDCQARWERLGQLWDRHEAYCERNGMKLGYRLRQDRLP